MLQIHFEGWFQCRLATNPDPTDEPRGISGYTFALAGEPDFDRVIRFHNPVALRSHGPNVGVAVVSVAIDSEEQTTHPLLGAAVDLLGDPRFESRNVILSDDRGGVGVIHPFIVRVAGDGLALCREDILYPARPDLALHLTPPPALNRRAPVQLEGMVYDSARVAIATGIDDAAAYRARRRKHLEHDRAAATNDTDVAALDKRIRELSITEANNIRTVILNVVQDRRFDINGPADVRDERGALGMVCDTSREWPVAFWMGAWDADAMCGFVKGSLTIPALSTRGRDEPPPG